LNGGCTTIRSERDRERIRGELAQGLQRLEALEAQGAEVLELQPLMQVIAPSGYPAFREAREQAWRRQGGTWTTRHWPADLADDNVGVLLLPLPAGRVGVAAGKHPRVAASPMFTAGRATMESGYHDACLTLLTSWVCQPGPGLTARLAPPVIEVTQRRGLTARAVERFGQPWPLPIADGV
jgi:hypothetical protein